MIEKVEVIKGPASSVWGSSLGGVINVITKAGQGGMKAML
jgi:vitamin B12 transporter